MVHVFENVIKGQLQIANVNYEKWLDLYFFNKVVEGPRTSFQSPAMTQKHGRNVCHAAH